jgi:hypothetical protein
MLLKQVWLLEVSPFWVWGDGLGQGLRSLNREYNRNTGGDWLWGMCRGIGANIRRNNRQNVAQNHGCHNLANNPRYNFQNNFGNICHCILHNVLRDRSAAGFATWIVSQMGVGFGTMGGMRRRRLDPKHVRDYFHKYALFTRLFHLAADGVWWAITRGFAWSTRGLVCAFWRLMPRRFSVDERLRRLHSFVVGRTGSGKSVLLHNFIRHYLTRNTQPALVLLDPHGDLADMIAKDRALQKSDRLVYIQFGGFRDFYAHFNPFDLPNPTEEKLSRAQLQFAGAVEQIIGESFTPRQRTLIRSCLAIMLHKPGATLVDLLRLLQDGQNADLVHYGQENLPNVVDRQFFAVSFADPQYKTTKLALVSRLTDIIRDPVVRHFTCQPSSINLGDLLDRGKVIVVRFDPHSQGRDTIRTIGQLFNAAILSHVLGRPRNQRAPIHMFVDECQYFVSSTIADILGESRKFGLYLTLSTQRTEALDGPLQDAILGNVGNLWIGGSRHVTADKLAKETGIKFDQIRKLANLQFLHVAADRPPVFHRLRYLGYRYAITPRAWKDAVVKQVQRYYRRADSTTHPSHKISAKPPSWKPDLL